MDFAAAQGTAIGERRSFRWALGTAVVLCAGALLPIWTLEHFPGQDTPNHLYSMHVLEHVAEPPFASYFRFHGGATTNIAFHAFMRPVQELVGLDAAHRLFLSLYAIAFFAGALYLAGSVSRRRWPLGLLATPFVFNWYLTTGLYNFVFTIPFFCFAAGLLLRHPTLGPRPLALLALLGVLAGLGHPFTVMAIGLVTVTVPSGWRGRLLAALSQAPAVALAALGVLGGADGGVGLEWPEGFPSPLFNIATAFYRFAVPLGAGEVPAVGPAFALLVGAGVAAAWNREGVDRRALRMAGVLTLVFFLMPERSFDLDHMCTRMVGFIVLSLPAWARLDWLLRRGRLLLIGAAVLSLGASLLFWRSAREIDRDVAEYTAGLEAVPVGATLLPLTFDARSGPRVVWPIAHAWGYYGVARDAITPYALYANARRPASWLAYRVDAPPLPMPDGWVPERLASGAFCGAVRKLTGGGECAPWLEKAYADLVEKACAYDSVLTWAAPAEMQARLRPCFRSVFARGRLTIYQRLPGLGPSAKRGAPRPQK